MTRLEIAIDALKRIRDFGHVEACTSHAPVHECGCYEHDEQDIARDALEAMERAGR